MSLPAYARCPVETGGQFISFLEPLFVFFMVVVAFFMAVVDTWYHRISIPSGSSMSNQLIALGLVSISGTSGSGDTRAGLG